MKSAPALATTTKWTSSRSDHESPTDDPLELVRCDRAVLLAVWVRGSGLAAEEVYTRNREALKGSKSATSSGKSWKGELKKLVLFRIDSLQGAERMDSTTASVAYVDWIRRFVLHHNKRHPRDMGAAEVEALLAHLAVGKRVSAST